MAFVCVLENSNEASIISSDGKAISVIPIGYDDSGDETYALVVTLDRQAGGDMELSFWIEADSGVGEPYNYFSGRDTRYFIFSSDRAKILAALLSVIRELVVAFWPKCVTMFTVDENLPPNALKKFNVIAMLFERLGYRIRCPDSYYGRRVWNMERMEQELESAASSLEGDKNGS